MQTRRVPELELPNPFRIAGELPSDEMIDRDDEAARLLSLAAGGHASRLVAPRRYGKTSLLRRVLVEASAAGYATALVDLEGVLSLSSVVVRIERAYDRALKGAVRRTVDALFRAWQVGLSLGAGGFTASLQSNPRIDVESVLLRLLDLPSKLYEREGVQSLVAFDEFQDLLRVDGADGILRSVLQHQTGVAAYAFAGSAPTLMERLFQDPSRPLLEHAVHDRRRCLARPGACQLALRRERNAGDAGASISGRLPDEHERRARASLEVPGEPGAE